MAARKRTSKRRAKKRVCAKPKRRSAAKRAALDSYSPVADVSARRRRKPARHCRKRKPRKRRPATRPPIAPTPQPVPPPPQPIGAEPLPTPLAVYGGPFGRRQAERLLWRAGFGPSPGHAEALAAQGLHGAVRALTRPTGAPTLTGAEPTDGEGGPLFPNDAWGHDVLWFLDRMVRTDQPLVERMTLIWHDWFATSLASAQQSHMIGQNETFRRNALGPFDTLVHDVTTDPAMIVWLNQDQNTRWAPNENYARELMELFTLGADRGAYNENDVRELARSLTGWDSDWSAELGTHNFRFVLNRHDQGVKTVFGQAGKWNWQDALRLCLEHPLHSSFLVEKLWSYFIPVPPSASDRQALESLYRSSGYAIRPLVEAILLHPQLYEGPRMVKPPVVWLAGMLRTLRRPIDTSAWVWLADGTGQRLFMPPNVAGWDDDRWLDTSTLRARWEMAAYAVNDREIGGTAMSGYDATETPETAVRLALDFWGDPPVTAEGVAALTNFARSCLPASMANWQQSTYRAIRQNALRVLIATCPDLQTS